MGNCVCAAFCRSLVKRNDCEVDGNPATEEHLIPKRQETSFTRLWGSTAAKDKTLLLYMIAGRFSTSFCIAVPSPFLARVIAERGGTLMGSVIVMQVSTLMMALSSGLFVRYKRRLGYRTLLFSGIVIFGTCQAAFGFIGFCNSYSGLISAAVTIKSAQGIGFGAYLVGQSSIVAQEFTEYIIPVLTIDELAVRLGYCLGPLIGGIFFTLSGGLLLPCFTSGLLSLLSCLSGIVLLRNFSEADMEPFTYSVNACGYFLSGKSMIAIGCLATIYGCFGMFDVHFTVYLQQFSFSILQVGVVMFTSAILYCVICSIAFYIPRKHERVNIYLLVVTLAATAGTSALFSLDPTTGRVYAAGMTLRLFGGLALDIGFSVLLQFNAEKNPQLADNMAAHILRTRVWNYVIGVGSFSISVLASFLEGKTSYKMSMLLSVGAGYLCACIAGGLMVLILSIRALKVRFSETLS